MRTVTLKQFAQEEKLSYVTCTLRVRRMKIEPVSFDTEKRRGIKAWRFNYNELLKIKELKQEILRGTMTLKMYAKEHNINLKTLASSVYLEDLKSVGETCSITGGGRKARLFNISDLNKLRIRKK